MYCTLLFQGPVLGWLNCLEAMKELGQEPPINLKVTVSYKHRRGSLVAEWLVCLTADQLVVKTGTGHINYP